MDADLKSEFEKLNRRLDAHEKNIDLCVNYCRAVAQRHLTDDKIAAIEAALTSGIG